MATTIKLKNGSGAPTAGDLVQGEPAFDLTNKRLYTEDSGGTVIEVGATPTSLTTTGTVTFGSLSDGAITITAFVDEDNMVSNSATLVPTQQSVKAYVDSQVTAQDLDFQGDSGGALSIDLDSETLTIAGGTGIDTTGATNTLTVAIDSTVTTLTGTQTLTNKTLTTPVISSISNTGTLTLPTSTDTLVGRATTDTLTNKTLTSPVISSISNTGTLTLPTSTDVLVGRATTDTLTNKTLTSPVINTGVSGTAVLDDDTFATASATTLATSESIKAYVDAQVDTADQLAELSDVNITTPADGALLFYDTGTTKWIDNVVSGDITIADTGVAAISSGVIVNADVNASAAISVSKTALTAGTGLTLSTDTLSVDASQTQITAVGTIGTGTWQGTAIADAYVADNLTISGGTVDNTVIGGTTAAAGTFTTFTSTGIDDNATSTAITIDSSQNVGIGTASPSEPLTIRGAVNSAQLTLGGTANRGLKISTTNPSGQNDAGVIYDAQDTGGGGYGTHQFQIAGSTKLIIDSSGNVGIGTTSIDSGVKIHVEESSASLTAATTSSVALFERAGNAGISIGTANTGESTIFFQDTDSATIGRVKYDHADDSLGFWANGSERARIDSSGNVGIGTTSPAKPLHIFTQSGGATTTPLVLQNNQTSANTAVEIRLAPSTQPNDIGSTARWSAIKAENTGTGQATELSFWTNASSTDPSERVRIDSSGNVGIGTTSPAYKLSVHADAVGTTYPLKIENGNTTSGNGVALLFTHRAHGGDNQGSIEYVGAGANNTNSMVFKTEASGVNGMAERMRIDSSGNLLVGCTSQPDASNFGGFINPIGQFRSSRNSTGASTQFSFNNPNGEVGTIVTSGTSTAYNTSSDVRLKENIVDAPAGNIDAIRVRSFDWKADGSHQTYGMVAQELFDVAPEAVSQGQTEEDMWGVDYSKLVPMMIKEIQDLKAEVAALKGA